MAHVTMIAVFEHANEMEAYAKLPCAITKCRLNETNYRSYIEGLANTSVR